MYECFRIIFFIYIIVSIFFIKPIYKGWKVLLYKPNIPNREMALICAFPAVSAVVGMFVLISSEWVTIRKFFTKESLKSWWKSL